MKLQDITTTNQFNQTVFTDGFIDCENKELMAKLLTLLLSNDIQVIEGVLKNTYCKNEQKQIFGMLNTILEVIN